MYNTGRSQNLQLKKKKNDQNLRSIATDEMSHAKSTVYD